MVSLLCICVLQAYTQGGPQFMSHPKDLRRACIKSDSWEISGQMLSHPCTWWQHSVVLNLTSMSKRSHSVPLTSSLSSTSIHTPAAKSMDLYIYIGPWLSHYNLPAKALISKGSAWACPISSFPSPSCPWALWPRPNTLPSSVRKRTCPPPAAMLRIL